MGLILDKIKYKEYLNDITYHFVKRKITGIYGINANYLLDIINGDILDYEGTIDYEKEIINNKYYKKNPSTIALIEANPIFYTNTVSSEFKFNLEIKRSEKKLDLDELLNEVGLNSDILNREIKTLSASEKYLLSIAVNLYTNPDIILFKDIFEGLDYNNKKKIIMLINNLKEDKKIIIVTSKDTNILYTLTDEVLLLDKEKIYKSGTTDKIFTSNEVMKEGIIPMPSIIKVSYLAKTNKKIKLSYHKDVRDIIKDIYKHV